MSARLHVSLSRSRLHTALHADILVTEKVFIHGGSPHLLEGHALFVETKSHPAHAVHVPLRSLPALAVVVTSVHHLMTYYRHGLLNRSS